MESSSGSRLMSAAASASSSPSPVDVRSLLGSFRLRKAGKWADVAPYLAEINIEFDPALDGTTGCKELWRQSRSKKVSAVLEGKAERARVARGRENKQHSHLTSVHRSVDCFFCSFALQIRALHPKYTVGLSCNEHGTPAAIKAKYQDGKTVTIDAQNKSLPELINALLEATESMKDKEDQVELDKN